MSSGSKGQSDALQRLSHLVKASHVLAAHSDSGLACSASLTRLALGVAQKTLVRLDSASLRSSLCKGCGLPITPRTATTIKVVSANNKSKRKKGKKQKNKRLHLVCRSCFTLKKKVLSPSKKK